MDADEDLLAGLRAGDEVAFAGLVQRYHPRLVRFAMTFVPRRELAEDAAQETWLAVVRGVEGFEGRSSLRTWMFQICANRARTLAQREDRHVPVDPAEPTVSADHFDRRGGWSSPPQPWSDDPGRLLETASLVEEVRRAIDTLPENQRQVVVLRDVEGLSGPEVCAILSISPVNQRVLLHRGRARARRIVDGRESGT